MGVFKGFTFDGISSLDYGIYTTGTSVYNAPERDVEMIEIAGKNGALAIDNGRWQNIEVTYTCSTFAQDSKEFAEKLRTFINEICSRISYVRLEDDYNPDEYRLALYRAGVDVEAAARNKAGEFDLVFECKPQRFLTSGEEMITVGDWGDVTEYSGDIVTFEADEMTAIKSLSVSLAPVQNLNGYDHPWVGGAGKNKLIYPYYDSGQTISGVTFTVNEDGTVTANGTATANAVYTLSISAPLANGDYILSGGKSASKYMGLGYYDTDESTVAVRVNDTTGYGASFTAHKGVVTCVQLVIRSGVTVSNEKFYPMIRLASVTDATWEPYSNICPISGWDGVRVTRAGKNLIGSGAVVNGYLTNLGDGYVAGGRTRIGASNDNRTVIISVAPNTTYTYKWNREAITGTDDSNIALFDEYPVIGTTVGAFTGANMGARATRTFTTGASTRYIAIKIANVTKTNPTTTLENSQLELGSVATAYEPYQGETITQEFEDSQGNTLTVYGGESEIVGGVLTVDVAMYTFNGTEPWAFASNFFYVSLASQIGTLPKQDYADLTSNGIKTYVYNSGMLRVYLNDNPSLTSESDMAQIFSNGAQLCYELATPITYTLTPQQVETLIGTNNIWNDAGEVTVEVADDPNKIVNPTLYNAKPLIKVSGYGTVTIGSVTITIEGSASDVTYIDCDSMECYRLNGLAIVSANSAVSFSSYDFPVLEADAITGITYSTNISQVQIVPRWWQL